MSVKTKTLTDEKLAVLPPDNEYLSSRFVLKVPVTDQHFQEDPWHLRLYALELLEQRLGDDVQLTSLKIKKPHAVAKSTAKLLGRPPRARLYLTVKF